MASLMEELIGYYEDEIELYTKLVAVSKSKTGIIVKGDIEALELCTEEEQNISTDIKNLDNKRIDKLKEMATVINKPVEELTIPNLIGFLKSRPQEQEKLENIRTELKSILDELGRVNAQNEVLLKQAMELVEFDLMLYKSLRQAPETANYDRRAYNTGQLLGGGGFDAKQ